MNMNEHKEILLQKLESMVKLGKVMEKAATIYKEKGCSFYDAVNSAFNQSFGYYEQSQEMQDVYLMLCDMGYTPRLDQ